MQESIQTQLFIKHNFESNTFAFICVFCFEVHTREVFQRTVEATGRLRITKKLHCENTTKNLSSFSIVDHVVGAELQEIMECSLKTFYLGSRTMANDLLFIFSKTW